MIDGKVAASEQPFARSAVATLMDPAIGRGAFIQTFALAILK